MICAKQVVGGILLCLAFMQLGRAETIHNALDRAYLANPQLNAQRANTRGVDEYLPMARGTFLPTVNAQGTYGVLQQDLLYPDTIGQSGNNIPGVRQRSLTTPAQGLLVVNLNIFNGFRGLNGIDQAEAQVRQSRELLRNTEVTVLASAATTYMNVLRDIAIFKLRDNYVRILVQTVEITNERLRGGDVTRTDVYQAETALAQAKQDRALASVNLQTSLSIYRQIIGVRPDKLAPATPLDKLLPKDRDEALKISDADHPLAVAARYNVDVNELSVKIAEGQLLPTLGLSGDGAPTIQFLWNQKCEALPR